MKYTIMGFSQSEIVDIIESGTKIDATDLLILRWFVDFSHSGKMAISIIGSEQYYWVNYKSVLEDLPMLSIGKRMLALRLQKLVSCGILKSYIRKDCGTFTMYSFGERYSRLICSDSAEAKNISDGCQKIDTPGVNTLSTGMSKNSQPKNTSTKNPSSKKSYYNHYSHFIPPTLDEVKAYCSEINAKIDPEAFVDYYTQIGWVCGKAGKPMKDWKSAVRNWNRRESGNNAQKQKESGEQKQDESTGYVSKYGLKTSLDTFDWSRLDSERKGDC